MARGARNLKVAGLVLVAVLAVSAVVASAARAAETMFEWGKGATKLAAETDLFADRPLFMLPPGDVVCDTVLGTFRLPAGATRAPVLETSSIAYAPNLGLAVNGVKSVCTGAGGVEPKIEMNGCQYRFHGGGEPSEFVPEGTVDIACPRQASIAIDWGAICVVHIGSQNGLGPVIYRTIVRGPTDHATIQARIEEGIHYEHAGLCGRGVGNDGGYLGSITVKALTNGESQRDVVVR